ncbi:DUF3265 domain-containing protein [Vibrio vulnificus]|nr:DUF3265 domain-containing protein [Vibrio vulnificus]
MTNNLRVIQHAWHFWYAVVLGVESGLQRLGHCVLHTLIGRYITTVITGRVYGYHDQV